MANNEPMTAERRAAIKARCDAATPGPWTVESGQYIEHGKKAIATGEIRFPWPLDEGEATTEEECDANTAFIAHARQDIPDLLAEVDRLQAENHRLESEAAQLAEFLSDIDGYFSGCSPCPANIEWLEFECPHNREKTAFGCNNYEVDCWRAAARKATMKDEGND